VAAPANYKAFRIRTQDQALIPDILKGQMAVSAGTPDFAANATGLQIPGILDELYTYTGPLGATFSGGVPTLRVWAPTARSVKLHLFDTSTASTASQILLMTAGDNGTWSIMGDASWKNKFYLYEVEVYVQHGARLSTTSSPTVFVAWR
jgi:pullulanase/glycogen debranching enzyme